MKLHAFLKRIGSDNSGGTAIEYGLIAALVVVASIGAFDAVANENTGIWASVSNKINGAMGGN
jgi:pilus assembly protein Flp/PilA